MLIRCLLDNDRKGTYKYCKESFTDPSSINSSQHTCVKLVFNALNIKCPKREMLKCVEEEMKICLSKIRPKNKKKLQDQSSSDLTLTFLFISFDISKG